MKIKNRKMMEWCENNEIKWEIKKLERGEIGEDIRREGGEIIGMTT